MTRNRLLALAAGVGLAAALVLLAGRAFDLSKILSSEWPTRYSFIPLDSCSGSGYRFDYSSYSYDYYPYDGPDAYDAVNAALGVAGGLFMAIAFAAAARAFLRASQLRRRRLFATSALFFALYGATMIPIAYV